MTRQHTLTLAVVIIGISTVAAQVLKPTGQAPASTQVPDTPQPHGAEAVSLIAAPGRVEPISEEIDVAAELQGRLTDVLVDEGAQVTRGQVVARLEHADYDARLQSAQARLAVAHRGVFGGRDPIAIAIGRMTVALRRNHARAMAVELV